MASDRARVSQGCVDRLAALVVEFVRENAELKIENAKLRARSQQK